MNLANDFNPVPKSAQLKAKVVTLSCSYCNKEFQKQACLLKGGVNGFSKRYCSRMCQIKAKKENALNGKRNPNPTPSKLRKPDYIYRKGRTYKVVQCTTCRADLERRIDQVNQGTGNYCKPCLVKLNAEKMIGNTFCKKTGDLLKCKSCSADFYYYRSKLSSRKFCSNKCKYEWQNEHQDKSKFIATTLSGEQSPSFKHGKRVGKHVNKPKLRAEVIERDGGNWCLLCGKPAPGLHLHRVVYGSQGGQYELNNCVLLCGDHHAEVHSSKKKWAQLLIKHLSDNSAAGREWLKLIREQII